MYNLEQISVLVVFRYGKQAVILYSQAVKIAAVCPESFTSFTVVRGARFARQPEEFFVTAAGKGVVEVRKASQSGTLIATVNIDSQVGKKHKARVVRQPGTTTCDLCFILKGEIQSFDSWQFK